MVRRLDFIFVILALIFGFIFIFITPIKMVPDENAHLLRACEVASGIFYNRTPTNYTEYDSIISESLDVHRRGQHQCSGYSPVLYLFSSLGVKLGANLNGKSILYFGRILNLLVWIALIALAICITPVFKYQFLFVALLPMSIYEGMSLSADSFNNAFTFLFFAYLFKLIFDKTDLTKKDFGLLTLMTVISSFTKASIYPVFLFYFLPIKKNKIFYATSMVIIAVFFMMLWTSNNLTFVRPDLDADFKRTLLVNNPKLFVAQFFNIIMIIPFYLKSCIGVLGLLHIYLRPFFYFPTLMMFFSTFIFISEEKIKNNIRICALFIILGFFIFLHVYYYIIWTPVSSKYIEGVQGRYFIPILPLFFLLFSQNKKYFSDKLIKIYKLLLLGYIVYMPIYATVILLQNF